MPEKLHICPRKTQRGSGRAYADLTQPGLCHSPAAQRHLELLHMPHSRRRASHPEGEDRYPSKSLNTKCNFFKS